MKIIINLWLSLILLFGVSSCSVQSQKDDTGSASSNDSFTGEEQAPEKDDLENGDSSNSESTGEEQFPEEDNGNLEVGDTPYTIKYYKNSLNDEFSYEEVPEMEEVKYGVVGKTVDLTTYLLDKYIAGFVFNNIDSTACGVVEEDGTLVLRAYYEINRIDVSNYEEFVQGITFYPNAYMVLTNDIDPVAEYGVREEIWEMVTEPFIGVIDGQGFSVKNITLYNYTPPYLEHIAMFDEFKGELKNIGFDYIRSVPTYSGENNGNIARTFSGKAENVYFYGLITKTRVDEDFLQYGALFGVMEEGAVVRNCYIELQCTDKSNCAYDYGYLAGVLDASVTVENVVIATSNICKNYGKFIARYKNKAKINGTKVTSDLFAIMIVRNIVMDAKETVAQKAGGILGDRWICDGKNTPRLKNIYELF